MSRQFCKWCRRSCGAGFRCGREHRTHSAFRAATSSKSSAGGTISGFGGGAELLAALSEFSPSWVGTTAMRASSFWCQEDPEHPEVRGQGRAEVSLPDPQPPLARLLRAQCTPSCGTACFRQDLACQGRVKLHPEQAENNWDSQEDSGRS